ncbi:hypothetical protein Tco_0854851 [Tanacetum coccineum]
MSTLNNSNQQTLADSGANERLLMLKKGNYIPWESRFRRFLDNQLEDGERMWNSIQNGPYQRPMIPNPDNTQLQILEPLSKMTEGNKKQYIVDVRRIKSLMFGYEVTSHVRHSRLMDEFDKFAAKEEESLESVASCSRGELLYTKQRVTYQRFEQVASCSRGELLYTKQRVAYQRFAYQRFEQMLLLEEKKNEGAVQQVQYVLEFNDLSAEEKNRTEHDEGSSYTNNDPLALVSNASVQQYNVNTLGKTISEKHSSGNFVAGNVGGLEQWRHLLILDQPKPIMCCNSDECDAFDSDVARVHHTDCSWQISHRKIESTMKTGTSYDSNTPFEVQDHDTFVNHLDEYHEVHEMQTDEQHNYVVDSDADYTSNSNIIPYDQYVEDNEDHVVQRNVSSVRNDALMSILDEMHEQGVQSRLANKPDMIINDSVTSELARYKELVGEYEKRAKFELTDRERKIDEQMRIIISDRNRKETSLKSELHSAQILLSSTVGHYKSKTEEVIILKKDFKQKEDKFLEEFLDIKRLKDKIEDRLYKQDQSVQTVHMLCKPKSFYDEKNKVAIGYKNPLCLTRAKQAQSALYNGHVLVTTNHTPTVIHDSEDTREIAEITRKRMLLKMQSPLYDNNRKKAETSVPKPISALTVYPPNTLVKLVPRILPTKSQVKINLYVLTQLFTEFDKTCKTRITPSGVIIEGERGFEQTKRCYLTKVIPFFKTLKEYFVGVQTALFKEVKEMEEIFDQMNNEVDKNTVDKQCAEIGGKITLSRS